MFFDTHTHLDLLCAKTNLDLAEIVKLSNAQNVTKMLLTAVKSSQFADFEQFITSHKKQIYYGLGLHPIFIAEHQTADLDLLKSSLQNKSSNYVAVAEIGLDRRKEEFVRDGLWQKQLEFFNAQLAIAQEFNLPVSIHSCKAHTQTLAILKNYKSQIKGVIHGFSGNFDEAKNFIDLGFFIGISGIITYPRANKTREAINKIPLDCMVLETDSPDMPLCGFQGEANFPQRLPLIFNCLAELKNLNPSEQVQSYELIYKNSCELFKVES